MPSPGPIDSGILFDLWAEDCVSASLSHRSSTTAFTCVPAVRLLGSIQPMTLVPTPRSSGLKTKTRCAMRSRAGRAIAASSPAGSGTTQGAVQNSRVTTAHIDL
jgi:hypothetical protein